MAKHHLMRWEWCCQAEGPMRLTTCLLPFKLNFMNYTDTCSVCVMRTTEQAIASQAGALCVFCFWTCGVLADAFLLFRVYNINLLSFSMCLRHIDSKRFWCEWILNTISNYIRHPWEAMQAKSNSKSSQATFCGENRCLDKLASLRTTSGISSSFGEANAKLSRLKILLERACLFSCYPLCGSALSRWGLQRVKDDNIFQKLGESF